jgi:putative DNA primase/helicase
MSVTAERSILGAILLDNAAYTEASQCGLKPNHFLLDWHQRIYCRMIDLAESSRAIDLITLGEELDRHRELERVGGYPYICGLLDGVPDRPSVKHYVKIVRDAAAKRFAAKQIERAQRAVSDPSVSVSAIAELASTLAYVSNGETIAPQFSEDALALRFSKKHGTDWRYVNAWRKWMRWDGSRWAEDSTLHVLDLARAICREASAECGDRERKIAARLASKDTAVAVERLAESDRCHATTIEQWDSDPWLLNTPTGTINLRTGELRPHRREEYLTKITAAGPDGDCTLWLRFLDCVTGGDSQLQGFLQRVVGYCLTGITHENALFFLYGTGANGKSVFLSTISGLLSDYAKTAPASSFTASTNEQHPTDLAGLRGARFVTANETEDGARWAESKIKSLTGGDKIAARFMRCDFFEFRPEFKLVMAGNHKPGLRSVDEAMRRRFYLIPFTVTIPASERDPFLSHKLLAEFAGILSWAVQGCLNWQREGLNPPDTVRDATANYLAAEDSIGRWLEERCVMDADCWTASAMLFGDWTKWCEITGEAQRTQRCFSQQLEARGFQFQRTSRARGFKGVQLQRASVTLVTLAPV